MISTSIFSIPTEVKEHCNEELKKIGYTSDFIVRASNVKGDSYLYYVIAHKTRAGLYKSDGYACWLYNHSLKGLYNGTYDISETWAFKLIAQNIYSAAG